MNVLFFDCCPHTELEERFWTDVRTNLLEKDIHFSICHAGPITTELPKYATPQVLKTPCSNLLLKDKFHQRCSEWKRSFSDSDYQWTLARIEEALLYCVPDHVVLWNGEQPYDLLVREMLQVAGCEFSVAERTPWPGLISFDRKGILCNCEFLDETIDWNSELEKEEWSRVFGEYEQEILESSNTWWNQPETGDDVKRDHRLTVLFAGQVDGDTQNFLFSPHFSSNLEAFRWFVEQMKPFDVRVIGKHHPKSDTLVSEYRCGLDSEMAEWRDDVPLREALKLVDAVVATNSSVLCEALIYRKPAFALGRTMVSHSDAIEELTDKTNPENLIEWILKLKSNAQLSEACIANWCEFSAFHCKTNLYAMRAKSLQSRRGPKALADEIVRRVSTSKQPEWNRVFTPAIRLSHYRSLQKNLTAARADSRRLSQLRNSRFIRMALAVRSLSHRLLSVFRTGSQ